MLRFLRVLSGNHWLPHKKRITLQDMFGRLDEACKSTTTECTGMATKEAVKLV